MEAAGSHCCFVCRSGRGRERCPTQTGPTHCIRPRPQGQTPPTHTSPAHSQQGHHPPIPATRPRPLLSCSRYNPPLQNPGAFLHDTSHLRICPRWKTFLSRLQSESRGLSGGGGYQAHLDGIMERRNQQPPLPSGRVGSWNFVGKHRYCKTKVDLRDLIWDQ